MSTKNNPGDYDCYANAEPDEPMFILLGRDVSAAYLVGAWTAMRAGDTDRAVRCVLDGIKALRDYEKPLLPYGSPKSVEAQQCGQAMMTWAGMKRVEEIEKRLKEK